MKKISIYVIYNIVVLILLIGFIHAEEDPDINWDIETPEQTCNRSVGENSIPCDDENLNPCEGNNLVACMSFPQEYIYGGLAPSSIGCTVLESCAGVVCNQDTPAKCMIDNSGNVGCDCDNDGVAGTDDCDNFDPTRSPDNKEICDGKDNDCDGVCMWGLNKGESCNSEKDCPKDSDNLDKFEECNLIDEDFDDDLDRYTSCGSWGEEGYISPDHADFNNKYIDCDNDPSDDASQYNTEQFNFIDTAKVGNIAYYIHPGAEEKCDAIDNNCDGVDSYGDPDVIKDIKTGNYSKVCDNSPPDGLNLWGVLYGSVSSGFSLQYSVTIMGSKGEDPIARVNVITTADAPKKFGEITDKESLGDTLKIQLGDDKLSAKANGDTYKPTMENLFRYKEGYKLRMPTDEDLPYEYLGQKQDYSDDHIYYFILDDGTRKKPVGGVSAKGPIQEKAGVSLVKLCPMPPPNHFFSLGDMKFNAQFVSSSVYSFMSTILSYFQGWSGSVKTTWSGIKILTSTIVPGGNTADININFNIPNVDLYYDTSSTLCGFLVYKGFGTIQ